MEFEATTPCRLASRSLLMRRRCFKLAVGRTLPLHVSIWSIWSNWSTIYLTLCCFHMWCASAIRDALSLSISSSQLSSNQNTRIAGTKCPAMDLLQKMGVFLSCFCDALTCVLRQTLNVFEVRGVSNLGWFGTLGPARTDYLGVPWAFFGFFVSACKGHFSAKLWLQLQGTSQKSLLLTQRSMVGRCILQKLALLMVASFCDTTSECLDGLLQLWSWSKNPLKDMAKKICRTFSLFYQFMMKFSWKRLASKPCHYYQL